MVEISRAPRYCTTSGQLKIGTRVHPPRRWPHAAARGVVVECMDRACWATLSIFTQTLPVGRFQPLRDLTSEKFAFGRLLMACPSMPTHGRRADAAANDELDTW